VKFPPPATEEHLPGGILKKGMLEKIDRVRWCATTVDELRANERLQRLPQPMLGKPISNGAYYLIRKLSAECPTDLRYLLCRTQRIEAGGQ
jgi:hypothetical protein